MSSVLHPSWNRSRPQQPWVYRLDYTMHVFLTTSQHLRIVDCSTGRQISCHTPFLEGSRQQAYLITGYLTQSTTLTKPSSDSLQLDIGCTYERASAVLRAYSRHAHPRRLLRSTHHQLIIPSWTLRKSGLTLESRQYFSIPVSRTNPLPPHHSIAFPVIFCAMTEE